MDTFTKCIVSRVESRSVIILPIRWKLFQIEPEIIWNFAGVPTLNNEKSLTNPRTRIPKNQMHPVIEFREAAHNVYAPDISGFN